MKEKKGIKKVLIVDDDEGVREIVFHVVRDFFIGSGAQVWLAENGRQAWKVTMSCRPRPDIVITDIEMPKMNGIQFLEKTKIVFPELPVIVMTGNPGKYKEVVEGLGGILLPKPFKAETLQEILQGLIT